MIGNKSRREPAPLRLAPPPALNVAQHAVFLDLDGTLLEIEQRPDMVNADEALRTLLRDLHVRLDGALAIISGRAIADIDRILGGAVESVSGIHGQEHRIGGVHTPFQRSAQLEVAAERVRQLNAGDLLRVLIEHKGGAVAIHYRQAPEHAQLVRRAVAEIASQHGLKVLQGRMVVEFLPQDHSKSDAVSLFMRTAPFAGRTPIAVGDDVTDEDAFAAATAHGGYGVHVGEARHTSAAHRIANVSAVRSWLASSLGRNVA